MSLRFSTLLRSAVSSVNIGKSLAVCLLVLVSYSSAGPRIRRIAFKPLFSLSQPPVAAPVAAPYPFLKVHGYTGIPLQLESPHKEDPSENETPSFANSPDYPITEPEEPEEEDPNPGSGLGSILSLVPGGLSGLISLSAGSGRNEDESNDIADDRSGLVGLKADILTTILQNKKDVLTALKKDAIQLLIRKAKAKKAWLKNLLFGPPGYYYTAPYYYYPKKSSILSYIPFVGNWFGKGVHVTAVHLPGKQFPTASETYEKVDIPGKDKPSFKPDVEYQVPGTSYGVPDSPAPVPQLPFYEEDTPTFESAATTAAPQVIASQLYPYPPESLAVPQYPQPAQMVPYPVSYTFPQELYPYASNDYYDTAQSEINSVKEAPVYKEFDDRKKHSEEEKSLEYRHDNERADGSANGGNTEKRN